MRQAFLPNVSLVFAISDWSTIHTVLPFGMSWIIFRREPQDPSSAGNGMHPPSIKPNMTCLKVGQQNFLNCSSDRKPSAPLWRGMNIKGFPVCCEAPIPIPIMIGTNASMALRSLSGCRYISSMIPLVPLRVSPITSNGALVNPPRIFGNPNDFSSISEPPIAIAHFRASAPASKRALKVP